uniref:Uncharacterized protein n=1 Tax=Heterorhabditis bacteriophora TaxID=37862 RepID=A0A1I7XBK1_HETBA
MVRDSFVAYMDHRTEEIRLVLLMDKDFKLLLLLMVIFANVYIWRLLSKLIHSNKFLLLKWKLL